MTPPTRHESPMMKSGTATGLMPMMKGASIPPILRDYHFFHLLFSTLQIQPGDGGAGADGRTAYGGGVELRRVEVDHGERGGAAKFA